ncbi:helix-turn-helix domain-containing protein [Streptomyces xanthophaeus]|uniref:helix-turn-helix domain-containing protein n=1 Tax=Streptomyces xanthophaeus TaxID=67385 RepID=UPI0036681C1D
MPLLWLAVPVFAWMPKLPGPALQVLLYLLGTQQPGGLIVATHKELAEFLGMDRALVGRALKHLEFARLVRRQKLGIYMLNPMLSGGLTPAESKKAIDAMDPEDRLDVEDFEERYLARVQADEALRKRRAEERNAPPAPPADFAAHRRRRPKTA